MTAPTERKSRRDGSGASASPAAPDFEAMYDRYGGRVLNLAFRMTGNEETARDLAQDVWIKVYERIDSFQGRSDIFTWIYRVTLNHVLNHLKRERRARWLGLLDRSIGEVLREDDVDPVFRERTAAPRQDHALEDGERARRVWEAIQSLDPKYRSPIVLYHYEEMSYKQIAETMDVSLAAVEARIHRARKQLAKILGPLLEQM